MELELNEGDEFIDQLLHRYHISLLALGDFAEEHIREFEQAESIFDLKTERDKKLCLALFRLLSEKQAAAVSEKFCNRYNITNTSGDDIFFEQNKLFLIAAFIYNPSFFAMSWNLCGLIMSELAYEAESASTEELSFVIERSDFFQYIAASGAGMEMRPVGNLVEINIKGIKGELSIDGNKENRAVQFEFVFAEYHRHLPFQLEFLFVTEADKLTHQVKLDKKLEDPDGKVLIISSPVLYDIDISKGITVIGIGGIEID
jgi:hypothetical protein